MTPAPFLLALPGPSPEVDDFLATLDNNDELPTSALLLPECTSVIREQVFHKRVSHAEGQRLLGNLLALPFEVFEGRDQFRRAFDLAERFRLLKAYDMQYLAVAELTQSTLVTRDRGLRHAAMQIGVPVRFLA